LRHAGAKIAEPIQGRFAMQFEPGTVKVLKLVPKVK
jgi:hypothetical protein